uniref:Uncharacterized protein n=1 Tax=Glossina austeni TaxID=7395 RepID=A0A1A9V7F1_GLOAU
MENLSYESKTMSWSIIVISTSFFSHLMLYTSGASKFTQSLERFKVDIIPHNSDLRKLVSLTVLKSACPSNARLCSISIAISFLKLMAAHVVILCLNKTKQQRFNESVNFYSSLLNFSCLLNYIPEDFPEVFLKVNIIVQFPDEDFNEE